MRSATPSDDDDKGPWYKRETNKETGGGLVYIDVSYQVPLIPGPDPILEPGGGGGGHMPAAVIPEPTAPMPPEYLWENPLLIHIFENIGNAMHGGPIPPPPPVHSDPVPDLGPSPYDPPTQQIPPNQGIPDYGVPLPQTPPYEPAPFPVHTEPPAISVPWLDISDPWFWIGLGLGATGGAGTGGGR
jgi:hypothetical protein